MLGKGRLVTGGALIAVLLGGGLTATSVADDYELNIVMPNAANLVESAPVQIGGTRAGEVTALDARDGKAIVTVSIDSEHAPLPSGTKAHVEWKSLLGERVVNLLPGNPANPPIPEGGMMPAGAEQVELDQVLAALDPETREHVTSVVKQLDATMRFHRDNIRQTLLAAGPTVQALGEVLKAVGSDGPAIRKLVSDLQEMTAPIAARQVKLQRIVTNLTSVTAATAPEQDKLRRGLRQLTSTLDTTKRTLDLVPSATDEAVPLLNDLNPVTSKLDQVSRNLSPLLRRLRPTIDELRPALVSADMLLQRTPALLDTSHDTIPGIGTAVTKANPAVDFLRPYTPDLMGWLANWGAAFSSYDTQGHFFRGLIQYGATAANDNPGAGPGIRGGPESRPAPGTASGQPWTDANGSGMR